MSVTSYSSQNGIEGIDEKSSVEDELYLSEDYSSYEKPEKYKTKINNRIRELLICERIYVAQMEKLMTFLDAFNETSYTLTTDKICKEPRKEIKLKIRELLIFHSEFLQTLESRKNDLTLLASSFVEHKTDFEMYLNYDEVYKNYSTISKTPNEANTTQQENLMEPKRVLPLYVALLSELLKYNKKYISHAGSADLDIIKRNSELKAAIDSVKLTLDKINILRRIGEINDCPFSIYEHGSLIRYDEFKVTKDTDRSPTPQMCILFENILIFTKVDEEQKETEKKFNFLDSVSLLDKSVSISQSGKANTLTVWRLTEDNKKFTIKAETNTALMEDWSHDLKLILNERFIENA